jgi:hypothetical protein
LESALSKNFDILPLTFGEKITENGSIDFKERATDISAAMDYIQNQTAGQNLGAVILATDGNFNQGRNPLYSNPGLTVPIYAIAMGDSTIKKDIAIQRILNNSIIYLGDQFEVQVDLKAFQLNHEKSSIQVLRIDNSTESALKSEVIDINAEDWYHTHKFVLDANKTGTIHYSVRVSPIAGEFSKENNIKDFFVDVLDARQKILVLAASPHPDLAVFKKILEGNKNYSVDIKQFGEANPDFRDYNLIILHQLPSKTIDISGIIKEINKTQKPRLFVLGAMTDLSKFNSTQTILKIIGDSRNMNEVAGDIKESFSLFTPDPVWKEFFQNISSDICSFWRIYGIAGYSDFNQSENWKYTYQLSYVDDWRRSGHPHRYTYYGRMVEVAVFQFP